jgi:hypothetical protein
MSNPLAHAPASDLRAGLAADLLTVEEVIAILQSRAVKGPSRRLLTELTGERQPRIRPVDTALYFLTIATDGKARSEEWTYTRWALCPSTDGAEPAHRFRNGGPVNCTRPSAGKEAPLWMHRAVAYVRSAGPMGVAELGVVAEWFRANRVGTPVAL